MVAQTRRREPILAETRVKRQHYVPRFLLEQFASNSRIERLDLESGTVVATSTENVAVECGFYDVQLGERKLSAESWLADIVEGPVVGIIQRLAQSPELLLDLEKYEQLLLARFIVAQRFRVPAFRAFIEGIDKDLEERMAQDLSAALGRSVSRDELPDLVEGINPPVTSRGADASLFMLEEVGGFANLVLYKEWRIGRVTGSRQLYTSDNAVAAYLTPVRPFGSGGALAEHQFYFPLSPGVLLLTAGDDYDPEVDVSQLDPFGPRIYRDFNDWEVSFARHVISDSASRYLFGPGPYIERNAAQRYLDGFGRTQVEIAMRYQSYDPRPPRHPEIDAMFER